MSVDETSGLVAPSWIPRAPADIDPSHLSRVVCSSVITMLMLWESFPAQKFCFHQDPPTPLACVGGHA